MRLIKGAASGPLVLALLHFHLHREFRGSPLDYLVVAAAAAASWAGVPGPGEPVLIGAGLLAAHHRLDIGGVVIAAWIGASVGGVIGRLVGLKAGRALMTAPGPLYRARLATVRRGEEIFGRWPVAAILLTPAWVAGIHRVRNRVYQPTNLISAAVWAAGIGFGAYLVGPAIVEFVGDLGLVTGGGLIVLVALGVGLEVRRRRARRARREEAVQQAAQVSQAADVTRAGQAAGEGDARPGGSEPADADPGPDPGTGSDPGTGQASARVTGSSPPN